MKILFSFDVEGDFHKYIHSPYIWYKMRKSRKANHYTRSQSKLNAIKNYLKWRLVLGFRGYAKGNEGLLNILSFLEKEQVPSSLNICGYLYLKKAKKIPVDLPWAIGKLKKNHYFWQKRVRTFSDILEDIDNKNLDFGIHGFIHEAFPLESKETMDLILKTSVDAGKELGLKLKTSVPPFNMAFNKNKKEVLQALRKNKISTIRIAGEDGFTGSFTHFLSIKKIRKENGVNLVNLSASLEGTDPEEKIEKIVQEIKSEYNKNKVFCIMAHDYSFKTNKNLFLLMKKLRKLQENYLLKFTNLRKL
jgi:hypothetical protein